MSKFPNSPPSRPPSDQLRDELRRHADGIASNALNDDDNLLAFALAAPSIQTMVVKFRDNVTVRVNCPDLFPDYSRSLSFLFFLGFFFVDAFREESES